MNTINAQNHHHAIKPHSMMTSVSQSYSLSHSTSSSFKNNPNKLVQHNHHHHHQQHYQQQQQQSQQQQLQQPSQHPFHSNGRSYGMNGQLVQPPQHQFSYQQHEQGQAMHHRLQQNFHQTASTTSSSGSAGTNVNSVNKFQQQQQHQQQQQQQQQQPQQQPNYPPAKQFKILINHNRIGSNVPGDDKNSVFAFDVCPLTDDKLTNIIEPAKGEHRLQHTWTFWYLRFEKNFSWEHSQVDIATFSTIESFWGIFDRLLPLTETHHGCNYSIFKKGVRPIWEDPMNRNGGRFIFSINKENPNYKSFSDLMWTEFCMLIIGNSVPEFCEHICGIVGGNRNNLIKIAVWTRDSQCKQDIIRIGQFLKKTVHYDKLVPYEVHMDLTGNGNGRTMFNV